MGASNGSMTTMGQTLREAQRPTNSIITPKDTLVMGHWNVRSLYRGGATAQVAREMEGYKLDILGISECRWTGAGRQRITSRQTVMAGADPISEEVRRKRWYRIGHVLRKEVNNDCAVALGWKPEGKRNRGRPKTTWHRTVEKERETNKDGTHGQEQDRQQTTANSGEKMSEPCVPPGAKRFNLT